MITEQLRQAILARIAQEQCANHIGEITACRSEDFNTLRDQISGLELHERLIELEELFSSCDDLEDRFIKHCQARALSQSMTCLSANAMPNSPANKLYAEIYCMILHEPTLLELIKLMLPDITVVLAPQIENRVLTGLHNDSIDKFFTEEKATLERFADFVVWDKYVFDLRTIAYFDFNMHRHFHQMLTLSYPQLAHYLYLHNSSLRELRAHLMIVVEELTVGECIRRLLDNLRSFKKLNKEEPKLNYYHREVLLDFQYCIQRLPLEHLNMVFELKKTGGYYSLQHEIQYMEQGGGILHAASIIAEIYDEFENTPLLLQKIGSVEVVTSIVSLYGETPLPTHVEILTPEHFSPNITQHIWGYNESEYDDIRRIYSFPFEWHELLISQSISNAFRFTDYLRMMYWSSLSLGPILYRAFQDFSPGRFLSLIDEMIKIKFPVSYIVKVFQIISESNRLSFLMTNNLLFKAIPHTELFKYLWKMLPEAVQDSKFQAKGLDEKTFLQSVSSNVELVVFCINHFLHKINIVEELQKVNKYNQSILHYIAHDVISLQYVLPLLPEELQFSMIEQESINGNVLHLAARSKAALSYLLSLYNQDRLITLVKERTREEGKTLLYYSRHCLESFDVIWNLYPEEERLQALYDDAILLYILEQSDLAALLNIIFKGLPEGDRFYALSIILSQYPGKVRPAKFRYLIDSTSTTLDLILNLKNKVLVNEALQVIFDFIPMHERGKFFFKPYVNQFSPTLGHPWILDFIIQCLPESNLVDFFHAPKELDTVSLPQYMKDYINCHLTSQLMFESYTLELGRVFKVSATTKCSPELVLLET